MEAKQKTRKVCPLPSRRAPAGAAARQDRTAGPAPQVARPRPWGLTWARALQAAAKRFRVQKDGTIMRRHAGKQHINEKKSRKRKKFLTGDAPIHETNIDNLMGCIPHARIFIPQSRFSPGEQGKGPFDSGEPKPKAIPKVSAGSDTTLAQPKAKAGAVQQDSEHEPQLAG